MKRLKDAGRILIVDDDEDILTAGRLLLKRRYAEVVTCSRPDDIPDLLAGGVFDAVLLDMNFTPGMSSGEQGLAWLERIRSIDPDAVIVMITAHGDTALAVEAMKRGATDFVAKPWENEKLIATLSAAVALRRSRTEAASLKRSNAELIDASSGARQHLIGSSPALATVHSLIRRAAPTDANVLVTGENGTGKELVARELHRQSGRADQVFMTIDLGALSESLFESELFGHKKGAFTGADRERVGRLAAAGGGTLFLDEIGNIPLHLQARLLTVLEQRQVTPLGSNKAVAIDVRVIAATNLSGEALADENVFRQDLLFRLNTVEIKLPPLRERTEDIDEIAAYYADFYARKYRKDNRPFTPGALAAARAYDWPGNVRALRHAVERAVILAEGDEIEAEDLQLPEVPATPDADQAPSRATGGDETMQAGDDLHLERMERRLVEAALRRHGFNVSKAAKDLGLTRAALYRRMEKYGL